MAPARAACVAALLLAAQLAAAAVQLPAVLRQESASVYAQCSGAEKGLISGIIGACSACLGGACPDACCVEKPSSNQFVVCQVAGADGGAGCCIRVMGHSAVEIAALEVVTASGKDASGVCVPAAAGAASSCPATTCAIAGSNQQQSSCPAGVQVPVPSAVYASPAKCADGTPVAEAAGAGAGAAVTKEPPAATQPATQPATKPATQPATAAATTGAAPAANATAAATTGAAPAANATTAVVADPAATSTMGMADAGVGAAGAVVPVTGPIPTGCNKTFPGYRCQGVKGYPEVAFRGGCCVGECALNPSKGWGYWCPELASEAAGTGVPATTVVGAGFEAGPSTVTPAATAATISKPTSTVAAAETTAVGGGAASTTAMVPVVVTRAIASTAVDGRNITKVGKVGDAKCFHPSSVVELVSGAMKRIGDVVVGDSVKVGTGEFSEVFMWTHKDEAAESLFLQLTTQSGHIIVVTPGHYLYVQGGLKDSSDVVVGDRLVLGDGGLSAVVSVTTIHDVGLYNPQTLQGDIVVNGIKASTYTKAVKPDLAHSLLSPLRLAYAVFGYSSRAAEYGLPAVIVGVLPQGSSYISHH